MARWTRTSTAVWLGCGALALPAAAAQTAQTNPRGDPGIALAKPASFAEPLSFARPVRLQNGNDYLGATRQYPSPVLRDMDGDGLADLVLGDLNGRISVSLRRAGDGPTSFGPESPIAASDGSELAFTNW